jgi:hypothetical protein
MVIADQGAVGGSKSKNEKKIKKLPMLKKRMDGHQISVN